MEEKSMSYEEGKKIDDLIHDHEKTIVKNNTLFNKWYIPYILFSCIMLVYHIFGYKLVFDDIIVANGQTDTFVEQIKSLSRSFQGWSSRILINPIIWIVYRFGRAVWTLLDVMVLNLIFWGINKIINKNNEVKYTYILMLFMLQFPIYITTTVGWVVGTMSYIWPAAAAIFSCFTIKSYYDEDKNGVLKNILFCVLTMYATNKEELSVMLLVVFAAFVCITIAEKKISYIGVIQLVVSTCGLLFHMLSSDNSARYESLEDSISFVDKIELGFTTTFYHMFMDYDFFMLWFSLVLLSVVWIKRKDICSRIIALVPTLVWLLSLCGGDYAFFRLFYRDDYTEVFWHPQFVTEGKYNSKYSWMAILLILFTIFCIALMICLVIDNLREKIIFLSIIIGGYCGRMVVGFGEHAWLPYSRTYTFFYMGMIFTIFYLVIKNINNVSGRKKDLLIYGLVGITIFQVAINMIMSGAVDIGIEL